MRCIFCKQESSKSRSLTHIIPESLGNVEHVLPIGAVCDDCNQYFARKVEQPLLESPTLRLLRANMAVLNMRGRTPIWDPADGVNHPGYRQMGRFLAKIGLEVLALKTLSVPTWNEELVDQPDLDDLRNFARYNDGPDWPFVSRTPYPVNGVLCDGGRQFEPLHEFDILITRSSEVYLVASVFGVEMAINLGSRENKGFRQWLERSNWASSNYAPRGA